MPAIGASTTGVSTVSGPRVSEVGSVEVGTGPLSRPRGRGAKSPIAGVLAGWSRRSRSPSPGFVTGPRHSSTSGGRLLRLLRLGDLADPVDRVELLRRPEG